MFIHINIENSVKDYRTQKIVPGKLLKIEEWEQLAPLADFQPTKLALLCRISDRQMRRQFQMELQMTPSEWLRLQQCCLAKDLLSKGYPTKVVAINLKFASASHLCREFKKCFGVSPQAFALGAFPAG